MSDATFTLPMSELDHLEPLTMKAVSQLDEEEQILFLTSFRRKRRSVGAMMALAILFPIQLFFLGKVGLGVIFVLTGGGAGIWYIIEWFLTPKRVRAYNNDVAMDILQQMSLMRGLSSD